MLRQRQRVATGSHRAIGVVRGVGLDRRSPPLLHEPDFPLEADALFGAILVPAQGRRGGEGNTSFKAGATPDIVPGFQGAASHAQMLSGCGAV